VANKSDRRAALQQYEQQPDEFCARYRLLSPFAFTAADVGQSDADVYRKLAMLAVYPHLKHVPFMHDASAWLKLGISAAVVAAFGFVIFKNL